MKRLLASLLLAAFLLSPLPSLEGASPPIRSIDVFPKGFVTHIDQITVRVKLNDTPSKRMLILALDCPLKYDEGRLLLEPTEQPPMRVYRNLPGGECIPVAHLFYAEKDKVKEYRKEGPKVFVMILEKALEP